MTEITLRIEDESLLSSLRKIFRSLQGVEIVGKRRASLQPLAEKPVSSDYPRTIKAISRGHHLTDSEMAKELSSYPEIDIASDVDAKSFISSNSGKAVNPINKWL